VAAFRPPWRRRPTAAARRYCYRSYQGRCTDIRPTDNIGASAYAAFGRSGETGPSMAEHAAGSRFDGSFRTEGNQDSRAGSEALNVRRHHASVTGGLC
jgi:hypothetical protein